MLNDFSLVFKELPDPSKGRISLHMSSNVKKFFSSGFLVESNKYTFEL